MLVASMFFSSEGLDMMSPLANAHVELPFTPEDIVLAVLRGIWQGFLLFLSAMPWWFWLLLATVIAYRLYRLFLRVTMPAEIRASRRRRGRVL